MIAKKIDEKEEVENDLFSRRYLEFLIIKNKQRSSVLEVFKETIAAFKRLNRFSKSICQNKEHKGPNILVYLVALTKKFDKIFLALQKSRFTQKDLQNQRSFFFNDKEFCGEKSL